jgi:hypothetical protein
MDYRTENAAELRGLLDVGAVTAREADKALQWLDDNAAACTDDSGMGVTERVDLALLMIRLG